MKKTIALVLMSVCAAESFAANAAQITYAFTFSGANLPGYLTTIFGAAAQDNDAVATGSFTIDPGVLESETSIKPSQLTNFTMTVSGAAIGNGTFTAGDFSILDALVIRAATPTSDGTGGAAEPVGEELNLNAQLVGQTYPGDVYAPWGTPYDAVHVKTYTGDFNLTSANSSAPNEAWYYTLQTANGTGQMMVLTSLTPVPLPVSAWLLVSGLCFGGALMQRTGRQGIPGRRASLQSIAQAQPQSARGHFHSTAGLR